MTFKKFTGVVLVLVLSASISGSGSVEAADFIYRSANKIDFIKLEKAKREEKEGGLKHPHPFEPEQIRAILRSLRFNRRILLLKKTEKRELFSEQNVEFLAPTLIEAFQKVGPDQVVGVSYFTRDPRLVIQNDRLTTFRAFVKEDGLHLKFGKLYAKMLGDRTTTGAPRAMSEAQSLRVGLELQPGQNRISWAPEELVIDLAHYGPGGVTASASTTTPSRPEPKKDARRQEALPEAKGVRERLKELEQLKKDELITEKEYQRKRGELIQQL